VSRPLCKRGLVRIRVYLVHGIYIYPEQPSDGGLPALQTFSPCTSRIHRMVYLPFLLYHWILKWVDYA
jgi:hypothetical protein